MVFVRARCFHVRAWDGEREVLGSMEKTTGRQKLLRGGKGEGAWCAGRFNSQFKSSIKRQPNVQYPNLIKCSLFLVRSTHCTLYNCNRYLTHSLSLIVDWLSNQLQTEGSNSISPPRTDLTTYIPVRGSPRTPLPVVIKILALYMYGAWMRS